jgi:G3E family GTPase
MPTGCVCCKVRGDLVEGLRALAQGVVAEGQHFDAVVIETSGLSEVGPVAQTFFADRFVQRNFRLDAVLAVVDSQTAPAALRLAQEQGVAGEGEEDEGSGDGSDGDSSNGSDDDEDHRENVAVVVGAAAAEEEAARKLRGKAARLLCEQICLADVVLLNKMDLVDEDEAEHVRALVGSVNATAKLVPCARARVDLAQCLDLGAFSVERAMDVDALFLRGGAAAVEEGEVGGTARPPPGSAAFGFVARRRPDRRAAEGAAAAPGRAHLHASFASVGLESSAELDELSFSDWLESILDRHGGRLFRAKGVLFFAGVDEPSSIHCVGGHAECERMGTSSLAPSLTAARRSRLVFIGRTRGIEAELADGFRKLQVHVGG